MVGFFCDKCRAVLPLSERKLHQKTHNPQGHWSPNRDRYAQDKFRRAVMEAAGHRCQYVDNARRCRITDPLQAHHLEPGNDDPSTGVALCIKHHRQVDSHAR
jgi:predicted restriction endonuclease